MALLFMGCFVRSFYWMVWVWPGVPIDASDPSAKNTDLGMPMGLRAFFLTYPQINVMICSFLIQYPWLYDFILLQNGRHLNLVLRQQMKMFVVAASIFTVLMYLVYAISFPINNDKYVDNKVSSIFEIYSALMIFNLISGILVICQILSGARRIEMMNADFGKLVKR